MMITINENISSQDNILNLVNTSLFMYGLTFNKTDYIYSFTHSQTTKESSLKITATPSNPVAMDFTNDLKYNRVDLAMYSNMLVEVNDYLMSDIEEPNPVDKTITSLASFFKLVKSDIVCTWHDSIINVDNDNEFKSRKIDIKPINNSNLYFGTCTVDVSYGLAIIIADNPGAFQMIPDSGKVTNAFKINGIFVLSDIRKNISNMPTKYSNYVYKKNLLIPNIPNKQGALFRKPGY